MSMLAPPYFLILSRKVQYTSKKMKLELLTFKHTLFEGGWSAPIQRELITKNDAVGVLLYDPRENKVVLAEQFRVGASNEKSGPWQLEIIAGMMENNENDKLVAETEIMEEANYKTKSLIPICKYLNNPALSTEKMNLFCGIVDICENNNIGGKKEEGENIRIHIFDFENTYNKIWTGEICNAATIIALQWLQANKTLLSLLHYE